MDHIQAVTKCDLQREIAVSPNDVDSDQNQTSSRREPMYEVELC